MGSATATGAAPGPKEFAPGVRIDWQDRVVEVDAKVVLRKGALELLACSPRTREHESVLSVPARPMHIYQALGLLGLEPGSPVRYDDKEDRVRPPTGTPLEISVRYQVEGKEKTVPARRWLLDVERKRPPESVNWVFAGSRILEDGRLAADLDGTIVCVVDFEAALIALGALHTADNRHLWLAVNTEAVPPIDTPVTLRIRRGGREIIEVLVHENGTLRVQNRPTTTAELAKMTAREKAETPRTTVRLRWEHKTTNDTLESVVEALTRAGIDRASIELEPLEPSLRQGRVPE